MKKTGELSRVKITVNGVKAKKTKETLAVMRSRSRKNWLFHVVVLQKTRLEQNQRGEREKEAITAKPCLFVCLFVFFFFFFVFYVSFWDVNIAIARYWLYATVTDLIRCSDWTNVVKKGQDFRTALWINYTFSLCLMKTIAKTIAFLQALSFPSVPRVASVLIISSRLLNTNR